MTPPSLALAALALLAALAAWRLCGAGRPSSPPLSAALGAGGWRLLVRPGCGFCHKQLALLGGAAPPGLPVVDCSGPGAGCAGVAAVPAWVNARTGAVRLGFLDAPALREMAAGK